MTLATDHTSINEMDRTGLIDDAFNLAIAGEIPYSSALDMIRYISQEGTVEDSYYVWKVFSSRTSYMRTQLSGTEAGDLFDAFFRNAISVQYAKYGFEIQPGDTHIQKYIENYINVFINLLNNFI